MSIKNNIERMKKDGACDRVNVLISASYMLFTLGFSLFDDAESVLGKYGLRHGPLKQLSNRVYKSFDLYQSEIAAMISRENNWNDFATDYDALQPKILDLLKIDTDWKPNTNQDGQEK